MFLESTNHYQAHEYVTFVNCNVQKKNLCSNFFSTNIRLSLEISDISTILHLSNVHYMSLFIEQRLMFSIINFYFLTCVSASFFVFFWSTFFHFCCPVTDYNKTNPQQILAIYQFPIMHHGLYVHIFPRTALSTIYPEKTKPIFFPDFYFIAKKVSHTTKLSTRIKLRI